MLAAAGCSRSSRASAPTWLHTHSLYLRRLEWNRVSLQPSSLIGRFELCISIHSALRLPCILSLMGGFGASSETPTPPSPTRGDCQGQLILNPLFSSPRLLYPCKDLGLPLSAFRRPPDLTLGLHCGCSGEKGDPSSAVGTGHADLI